MASGRLGIVLQREAVFLEHRCAVGKHIADLNGYAERLKFTNDIGDLRIADIDDVFLEGESQQSAMRLLLSFGQRLASIAMAHASPDS
jgi:hypothetical protein